MRFAFFLKNIGLLFGGEGIYILTPQAEVQAFLPIYLHTYLPTYTSESSDRRTKATVVMVVTVEIVVTVVTVLTKMLLTKKLISPEERKKINKKSSKNEMNSGQTFAIF